MLTGRALKWSVSCSGSPTQSKSKNIPMLKEFKNFILKGNVVDLSTGVIIGAAFGGIVTAFTKGIVEPILALAGNGPNPKLSIPIMEKAMEVATLGKDGKPAMDEAGKTHYGNGEQTHRTGCRPHYWSYHQFPN